MIIKRWRSHKVNTGPGTYESNDFGAAVEIDTEDADWKDVPLEKIYAEAESMLDEALDNEVNRVANLPGIIKESHVFDFYEID